MARHPSRIVLVPLMLSSAALLGPPTEAHADVTVVYAEGTTLSEAVPGAEWYRLLDFAVAEDDGLAFVGRLTSGVAGVTPADDFAVFHRSPTGTLSIVARERDPAAGFPTGVTFRSFGPPLAASGGTVGFEARVGGPGVTVDDDTGTWLRTDATAATLVQREGDLAPGTVDMTFQDRDGAQYFAVRPGEAALRGTLDAPSMPPVPPEFVYAPAPPGPPGSLLALGGTPTPETGDWLFLGPVYLGHKHVVFSGVSDTMLNGLWGTATPGGTLEHLIGQGDPVPAAAPGDTLADVISHPRVEADGEIVFIGTFEPAGGGDSSCGAWARAIDGTLTLLVREGAPVPDGSVPYACLKSIPLRSVGGHLSFFATFGYSGVPPTAFFATSAGAPLAMVIAEGDDAPSLAGQPEILAIEDRADNERGGVVMEFFIESLPETDRVYFYFHPEEGLSPLLREGDSISVGAGDERLIDQIEAFEVSARRAVFRASFTDGTVGLLETLLPGAPPPTAIPATSFSGLLILAVLIAAAAHRLGRDARLRPESRRNQPLETLRG